MKVTSAVLAMAMFAGVACVAAASSLSLSELCRSNQAFDYTLWEFRKGFKAPCCADCKAGSMQKVCLDAYDKNGTLHNACLPKTPQSYNPCTNPNAPIPDQPSGPTTTPTTSNKTGLPELVTRDTCVSNVAFDYSTWQFRSGYKSLCCQYCSSGSMAKVCLNAYDACGQLYNACALPESETPCTKPDAPIPTGPSCQTKSRSLLTHSAESLSVFCSSNQAFDYTLWEFRTGYKAACCFTCKTGSMQKVCLNAYDSNGTLYNACLPKTPESPNPCTNPKAPIPDHPNPPAATTPGKGLPELVTRDTCKSNAAFDYTTWQFRSGYKSTCCQYCAAGSTESICLNVYDACGDLFYACGAEETTTPCTKPDAPIPNGPPVCKPKARALLGEMTKPLSDICASNTAFDYTKWQFRTGYKAECCADCKAGSMQKVCLNAYDINHKRYYACGPKTPESSAPCTNPEAPIPDRPSAPASNSTSSRALPDLTTRDICISNQAFDYSTWQFRTGFKNLCCPYCSSGSMERVCLNAYDACGNRYYACASEETTVPCTNPDAPIPSSLPKCQA